MQTFPCFSITVLCLTLLYSAFATLIRFGTPHSFTQPMHISSFPKQNLSNHSQNISAHCLCRSQLFDTTALLNISVPLRFRTCPKRICAYPQLLYSLPYPHVSMPLIFDAVHFRSCTSQNKTSAPLVCALQIPLSANQALPVRYAAMPILVASKLNHCMAFHFLRLPPLYGSDA